MTTSTWQLQAHLTWGRVPADDVHSMRDVPAALPGLELAAGTIHCGLYCLCAFNQYLRHVCCEAGSLTILVPRPSTWQPSGKCR